MNSSMSFLKQHLLPALVCFGLALALTRAEWFQNLQNIALDMHVRMRVEHQAPADPRVAVVGIDDESLAQFGKWPWERDLHGQFLAYAAQAKAAVITWDLLFTEPGAMETDVALEVGAIAAGRRGAAVVFGAVTSETPGAAGTKPVTVPVENIEGEIARIPGDAALLAPIAALQDAAPFALVNTPPGSDGFRRLVPLLGRAGDRVYFSLSLETLLQFWQVRRDQVRVRLGDAIYIDTPTVKRRIPIDEGGHYYVNYRFGLEQANVLGYYGLLAGWHQKFANGQEPEDLPEVEGKILLVGQVATGLTDNGPSPFSGHTPLVLVHANAIENILREDYVRTLPVAWVLLGAVVVGALTSRMLVNRHLAAQAATAIALSLLLVGMSTYAWIDSSIRIPVVWPLTGYLGLQVWAIGRRALTEQRAKAQIKGMFGTYVSPQLVERLVEAGEMPRLGGHVENLTAYFSDIQGFSTFSEMMPPERLVELMNEYLTACTDIVQEEGGTLDKYIGDAVVAMFGAPISLPDHAYRACVATLRVQQRLMELRAKWASEGDKWPEVVRRMQTRIGLNSGMAVVGNMGSRTRFNYTMMGDNVNLAARMESGAKTLGVHAMCTEMTKAACEQHGGDRILFRPLGRIVVKGRAGVVAIYELTGSRGTVSALQQECVAIFSRGLEKYYARDWDGAAALFAQSARLEANASSESSDVPHNPSRVYLDWVEHFRANPPSPTWAGNYVMMEK